MLGGLSPSKLGYSNDFAPNCPSAVPSPLYKMSSRQMPPPSMNMGPRPASSPQSPPGTLSDGSNILTHFYMANEHIDVLGRSMYDLIVDSKREQLSEVTSKHDETVAILQQQVDELKACIRSVEDGVGHASENQAMINAKLDQLMEFIKKEIADPVSRQSKKVVDMENDIKALQKGMQDLQKSLETKMNQAHGTSPTPAAPPTNSGLPHHRSQNFYDATTNHNRDATPRMPAAQESRNDGRFRSGNNSGLHWYRLNAARENNRDDTSPFNPPHSYQNNGQGPFGGGGYLSGGFGGYYAGSPEQTYGYNAGGPPK